MRLIGTITNSKDAEVFSTFLVREGIENNCEEGSIWVHNEDLVPLATQWLNQFQKNPNDTFFVAPILSFTPKAPVIVRRNRKRAPFITMLIVLCAIIFFYSEWSAPEIPKPADDTIALPMAYMPKIMNDLLYDYPYYYQLATRIASLYSQEEIQHPENGPKDLQMLLEKLHNTPYWQGFYDEFLHRHSYTGPMFEKIKQREIWRLFTPCLLHGNLLHILFNVLWIIILGIQIEKKIGTFNTIIFTVVTAIFSNTCEYLMTGPSFLGLSGVVCAMVGFIWMRQKKAPWEGYLLHSSTFMFITIFVLGMCAIELISFISVFFSGPSLSPGIANTAHISGGIAGILLGSVKLFARKPVKEYH